MPLPISKNQVRRLGERLRDATTPAHEDLDLLLDVLSSYGDALDWASERLRASGLRPSPRLKNTGTIIEKLRREPTTNLANIQDIAGLRVVLAPPQGRAEQDRIGELVVGAFLDGARAPRVHDRRQQPSQGYRAVHTVVTVDELPVEIQIRTPGQHRWAEFFEKLADLVGRGIRYGEAPVEVDRLLRAPHLDVVRDELRQVLLDNIEAAVSVAELIARLELLDARTDERTSG